MNRSGGYELRNPMFKGCISPKDISCVSLSGKKQDTCCVFEGFVDFLSALVLRTVADEDCLVLNSVSNLERSYAVLEGYGKIRCFLDRDQAGITALETLNIHFGNKVMDCSGLYDGFKDLNEYLTKTKENKVLHRSGQSCTDLVRIRAGNPAKLSVYRGNNAGSQGTEQE